MAVASVLRCTHCQGRIFSEKDERTGERSLRCINCSRDYNPDPFVPAPPQWEDSKRWYIP